VTSEDDLRESIAATTREFGHLDIAVNNAGINRNAAAEDTSLAEWDLHQDLNLRADFRSCQLEAPKCSPTGTARSSTPPRWRR